jgi:hypothetical protein
MATTTFGPRTTNPSDGPAEEVAMSTRKSPAPDGAKITAADVEAAERDRIVAASLKLQQATTGPPPPPSSSSPDPETAKVLAALDRAERAPTGDELASQMDADRRAEVARRNAEGAEANRAWAAKLRRSGYAGFTEGTR